MYCYSRWAFQSFVKCKMLACLTEALVINPLDQAATPRVLRSKWSPWHSHLPFLFWQIRGFWTPTPCAGIISIRTQLKHIWAWNKKNGQKGGKRNENPFFKSYIRRLIPKRFTFSIFVDEWFGKFEHHLLKTQFWFICSSKNELIKEKDE